MRFKIFDKMQHMQANDRWEFRKAEGGDKVSSNRMYLWMSFEA